MSPDPLLSDELKSLQEEVAAVQRQASERPAPASDGIVVSGVPTAPRPAAAEAAAPEEAGEDRALRDQLNDFIDHVTQFFEDAEKNIAAHPTESVIAALLLGILIGRLLGRG